MICVSLILNSKHLSTVLFFHIIPVRIQWYLWAFQMVLEMAYQNEAVFENRTTTEHKREKNSRTQRVGGYKQRNSICQHYQLTSIKCVAGSLITCWNNSIFVPLFAWFPLIFPSLWHTNSSLKTFPLTTHTLGWWFPPLMGKGKRGKSGTSKNPGNIDF